MMAASGVFWLQVFFLLYFIAVNLFYLALFITSAFAVWSYHRRYARTSFYDIRKSKLTPPVSILVPAHNEAATIASCVKSLLVLSYPEYEIVVVNDGSTDDTLAAMQRAFKLKKTARIYHRSLDTRPARAIYKSLLFPNLVVVDKENGGKADALNCGINVASYPIFCTIDSDSLLERDSLLRVIQPFLEDYFRTVAVGGMVRVGNGCTVSNGMVTEINLTQSWLPSFQVVEYLRAFLSGRMAFSSLNSLLILSGAFSLFKQSAVVQAGGFRTGAVGEDMELIVQMHEVLRERGGPYRIAFIPDPVCWTEVPTTLSALARQRNRWHRGLGESLLRHWRMLCRPKYGLIGMVAMPYFVFVEFLSPVLETSGLAFFLLLLLSGRGSWEMTATFFILAVLIGILLSLGAVLLEEFTLHRYPRVKNFLRLWLTAFLENLGYHQMTLWWRMEGIRDLVLGRKTWGFLERKGLEPGAHAP